MATNESCVIDKIPSFQRDHKTMLPGLYLQEVKRNVFVFDLRFVKPNTRFIPIEAIHTIEHLFATWLKTKNDLAQYVVSFNPGGCQTMFYLELFNDITIDTNVVQFTRDFLLNCIDWCLLQTEVPGATSEECGNYKSHDLTAAKQWLREYQNVLLNQN